MLAAFRAGDPEVPAEGEVRGDFLRGLFLDEKADYRGTVIVGAIISDVLDMEFCETRFPVRFRDCSFSQKIRLQQLTCPELDFTNCDLKKGIDTPGAKVVGDVNLVKVNAMDHVCLSATKIGGQLSCRGGSFYNETGNALTAQNIRVAGSVFLDDEFKARGAVWLSGAEIEGQLGCRGGSFQNKEGERVALNAQHVKAAFVVLCDGFKAEGEVSLSGADIRGQINCSAGSFQNEQGDALTAQNTKAAGTVFLCDGFKAEGEVSLLGAEIGGQLDCAGGIFQNEGKIALNARNIKVVSDVFLIHGRDEERERRNFSAFSANGQVFFANATIGGNLYLLNCRLTHLSLASTNVSGEFQDDADVYKNDQGGDIDLDIDGFRYQRLNAVQERIKDRLAWVGSMSQGGRFYPQPYEQLMQVYRATGHVNWAQDVGFALEKRRHQNMKWGWWKGWYSVSRIIIGYGYRPFRFLGWFLGMILLGTVFSGAPCSLDSWHAPVTGITVEAGKNHWNQCEFLRMYPTHAEVVHLENGQPKEIQRLENHPRLIPILYAMETAYPLFPLGQTSNWHPETWWVKLIHSLITLFGTMFLAILAPYVIGLLGPRWRDE